jgi:hypothetical protein
MKNNLDFEEVNQNLENFRNIALGHKKAGPIALLEPAERFRWLTAVRSSIIQTSPVHPGKTTDMDATFERLFEELVK